MSDGRYDMKWFMKLKLANKLALLTLVVAIMSLIFAIAFNPKPDANTSAPLSQQNISGDDNLIINENKGSIRIEN